MGRGAYMTENGEDRNFETIKITSSLKARLLDEQERLRKERGRKVPMTRLLTEALDYWQASIAGGQAQSAGATATSENELQQGTQENHEDAGLNAGGSSTALEITLNSTQGIVNYGDMRHNPLTAILDVLRGLAQTLARLESRIAHIESGSVHVHTEGHDEPLVAEPLIDPPLPHRPAVSTPVPEERGYPKKTSTGDHPRNTRK